MTQSDQNYIPGHIVIGRYPDQGVALADLTAEDLVQLLEATFEEVSNRWRQALIVATTAPGKGTVPQ